MEYIAIEKLRNHKVGGIARFDLQLNKKVKNE